MTQVNICAQRSSGVLVPLFSLPSPGGIGDLGPGALRFLDFLESAGQSFWQILPAGPTSAGAGNSPYMSDSALAGNPLFISPEVLAADGLLRPEDLRGPDWSPFSVDYDRVRAHREALLDKAWASFQGQAAGQHAERFAAFLEAQTWAEDYGLFLALKAVHKERAWWQWPEDLRLRKKSALTAARKELDAEIRRHCFRQYLFFDQWRQLRDNAAARGVRLIGDIPIYVALDSVDVWTHQDIFALDADGHPTHVAGVPPDYFSETGQLWGNPLYRWNDPNRTIRRHLHDWWAARLKQNFLLTDVLRLDHFRGFEAYWSVPAGEKTAIRGEWLPGPGLTFFRDMERRLGPLPLIAEDLGVITPEVEVLRRELGLPGMKILLFAFDGNPDNSYLPYNCEPASVIYTGTHDNETAVGWYLNPDTAQEAKARAKRFARAAGADAGSFHTDLLYLAMSAPSRLAVFPMQDILGFGNDCRMNTPGQGTGNWVWRLPPEHLNANLASWLKDLTSFFGRLPRPQPPADADDHGNSHSSAQR